MLFWLASAALGYYWAGLAKVINDFGATPMNRPLYASGPNPWVTTYALLLWPRHTPGGTAVISIVVHSLMAALLLWGLSYIIDDLVIRVCIGFGLLVALTIPYLIRARGNSA